MVNYGFNPINVMFNPGINPRIIWLCTTIAKGHNTTQFSIAYNRSSTVSLACISTLSTVFENHQKCLILSYWSKSTHHSFCIKNSSIRIKTFFFGFDHDFCPLKINWVISPMIHLITPS